MENDSQTDSMSVTPTGDDSNAVGTSKVIYILYLVGLLIPLVSVVGVIMAYVTKDKAPEWLQTHHQFQIRTFWIGLLYGIVGAMLSVILIGFVILLFYVIWLVVRCVKGISALDERKPVADPTTWMFG